MIRRLIILLLIVGCAPTKPPAATFYIGMSKDEFIKQNPTLAQYKSFMKIDGDMYYFDRAGEKKSYRNDHFYHFENDTLDKIFRGIPNVILQKEIDYSKFPNSKPE